MRRAVFDWAKRFNIIQGVARGLVYLHHDSCLKVSNVLLDEKDESKNFRFWIGTRSKKHNRPCLFSCS
ncbi:unnamed protein product [Prunus brigantina]